MSSKEVQPISREQQLRVDDYQKHYWRTVGKRILKDWRLYVMLIPLLLVFLFWRYLPMYELTAAFKRYDSQGTVKLEDSDFIGLYYFKELISGASARQFWPAFRNTFLLSFYGLLFGFPTPILLALFYSEIKSNITRSIMQVCAYLPKFVSLVVITSLIQLLVYKSTETTPAGVLARLFTKIGLVPKEDADVGIMNLPQYFRSVYQISGIWAEAGYGSIVYFAAIIGISPTSYEAARIDGASKMQQIKCVVLPGILSTVVIMLIMRLGHLMTVGFEKVMLLSTTGNEPTRDIISTFVFRTGGIDKSGGGGGLTTATGGTQVASAADMINALISMLLVTGANMISKRASNTSLY